MSGHRVLVTGGAGYVGRFIVEGLLQAGYDVTVAGRSPPNLEQFAKQVEFLPLALEPDEIHTATLEGFVALVHAAFYHMPGRYRGGEGDDPAAFRRLNLDGSVALFGAAKAAGVKCCVFLSSRAVYGGQPPGIELTEETPCHPDTLYGEVKLTAEQSLADLATPDFVTASLRVTGVYGGESHKWASLFDDFLAGKSVEPRVGTEVHGNDVVAAVRLMLERDPALVNGKSFNVSDILLDRRDLLALVDELAGTYHALPDTANASDFNAMSSERLRALGWQPGGWPLLEKTVSEMLAERAG